MYIYIYIYTYILGNSRQRTVTNYIAKEKTEPFPKTQASFRFMKKTKLHRSPSQYSSSVISKKQNCTVRHPNAALLLYRKRHNCTVRHPNTAVLLHRKRQNCTVCHPNRAPVVAKKQNCTVRHPNTTLLLYRKRQKCTVRHPNTNAPLKRAINLFRKYTKS